MIPEQWLKDVGDKVVKDYVEDDRNSSLSGIVLSNCVNCKNLNFDCWRLLDFVVKVFLSGYVDTEEGS